MPAPADWPVAPLDLRLPEGAVDVWRADLDATGDAVAALLSSDERARAARFARAEDGRRWARARGILRALLGRYADADPGALGFALGAHGKPALAGGASDLRFNLSHSADVALLAFARGREVGVDVELPRRAVDAVAVAARTLGAAEAQRLRALDPVAREREFLRAWVRYEAELKCRGAGIAGGAPSEDDGPPLWVVELDAGAPGAAALAVDGPPPTELRRWAWRD